MRVSFSKYLISAALSLTSLFAQAQLDPCISHLKDAASKTEQGWYDDAITLLENTLDSCNLNESDQIQAYKLLITNYLIIDNLEEAEAGTAMVMKINPNYESDKLRDPDELIVLFEKYKPTIVLRAMLFGGFNTSSIEAINTYSIVGDNDAEGLDNYKSITSFQLGLAGEYKVYSDIWLQLGVQFRRNSYSIDVPNVEGRTVSYNEDLSYIDVPLSAKYYFTKYKLQPYAEVGLNFSFLSAALGQLSRDALTDIVDRNSQRNAFNLGYFGGLGLAYNIKNYGFQVGVNYMYNPQQLNKEGTRYENLDLVFKYYYIDNDFTMNNLQFNVGFKYALGYKNALVDKKK